MAAAFAQVAFGEDIIIFSVVVDLIMVGVIISTLTILTAIALVAAIIVIVPLVVITFPILKELPENTTIYDIYSTGESNDLKVYFNESDGTTCRHMKYLK